jgi:AraC-like DNA-binding protein
MTRLSDTPADDWGRLQCEWLWVYHGAVPVCGIWSAEIPVPAGVFFVERGSGRIRAAGQELVVKRGEAFFSAPGLRQHWFAPGTVLLSAAFRAQWPDGRPLFRAGLNAVSRAAGLRRATQELFAGVHPQRQQVTYREAVQPVVLGLAAWAEREAAFQRWFARWCEVMKRRAVEPEPMIGRRPERMERLVAWLNELPLDQPQPTLPAELGWGQRRADQRLQQQTGLSLRSYLERRRLQAARERVLCGQDTLKEIAFALGFRHASHFTAWFRRKVGVSPSAYRAGRSEAV